jgi:hypothetical protein
MWQLLLKPWVWAAGGTASAYFMAKRQKGSTKRLREAKLELIEQQRTIDRLRAELGRERAQRQEEEEEKSLEKSTSPESIPDTAKD